MEKNREQDNNNEQDNLRKWARYLKQCKDALWKNGLVNIFGPLERAETSDWRCLVQSWWRYADQKSDEKPREKWK